MSGRTVTSHGFRCSACGFEQTGIPGRLEARQVAHTHRCPPSPVVYDREALAGVLVHHYRTGIEGCVCGWSELGGFWPEHVADVYELTVATKTGGRG